MQAMSLLFLLYLGAKFLLTKSVKLPTKLDAACERLEARLEQKIHPHSAFATGFVRVMANLGVLAAWVVLSANLHAPHWWMTRCPARVACVGGVCCGTTLWFLHPELRRVARTRKIRRQDAAPLAAYFRPVPDRHRLFLKASKSRWHSATRFTVPSPPNFNLMLKAGIVGLPNVGKSTLFNAVTRTRKAEAANYPFCTIDPNVGIVTVPDARLAVLQKIAKTGVVIPAAVEFVDIAGLVKGASQGEGLGNKFLSHIREVDAIVQVVRCFEDADIHHVAG